MQSATAFYLVLYGATLVVHVVFMNYVLGGTAFLAVASLRRAFRRSSFEPDPIAEMARDWLPFALGAAITAGVAPLLFLQVLYEKPFYTANLLLFHRWMSIVPVLIVGFYLLYLLKSRPFEGKWMPVAAIGAFLCVAWTGLSWTENHVLSLDEPQWIEFYGRQSPAYYKAGVYARFGVWLFGSLPTFALMIAWQLHGSSGRDLFAPPLRRRLERTARAGLLVSLAFATFYATQLNAAGRSTIETAGGWTAMLVGALAMVVQSSGWSRIRSTTNATARWLAVLTAATLVLIVAAITLRETLRAAAHGGSAFTEAHAQAASVGGFGVFVLFLILNAALVAWSIRIAFRSSPSPPSG